MTKHPTLRCLLTALVLFLLPGLVSAQDDWPQFRGADGRAMATSGPLPQSLDPSSDSLLWKTPIPGGGNSSPIVSKGQIFVTTAYGGDETNFVLLALALVAVVAMIKTLMRPRVQLAGLPGIVRATDRIIVLLAGLAFLGIAGIIAVNPTKFWERGIPGDTWLVTGMAASMGLFAAIGWLRASSMARLACGVALLAVGALLYVNLPENKHHEVYRLTLRMALIAPAVAGGVWHLLAYALLRGKEAGPSGGVAAGVLGAMSVLLFVTANFINPVAGLSRAMLSLDLETGKLLWDEPLFKAPEERLHRQNSFASPSPVMSSDGERVFAFFGPGWACVDRKGNKLWEGKDDTYQEQSHYGAVGSPIAFGDTFIVNHETERVKLLYSYIMALDSKTGDKKWRIQPGHAHESYMTPLLMDVGGETQMVTVSFGRVVSYDPGSGEKLWELELPTWQHVPSLTYEGDVLFVSGGAHSKWTTAAIRLTGKGKDTKPEILWQGRRNVPHSSSPVYTDGLLFTVTGEGMLVCYDAKSGDRHWRERLNGHYFSSLLAGDGKVYACSEEGDIVVFAAATEYKELSRTNIGETIRSTPAVAKGRILLRTDAHLYCFGNAKK